MSIQLTEALKNLLWETESLLKGAAKRQFIAQTVLSFGYGGQSLVQRELGWDKRTIRKGMYELKSGINCVDNFSAREEKK